MKTAFQHLFCNLAINVYNHVSNLFNYELSIMSENKKITYNRIGNCMIGRAKRAPTLGCSIEISRDIYMLSVCRYVVCLSYVKLIA